MITLTHTIHIYVRPDAKEQFLEFFTNILGLNAIVSPHAVGSPEPIYALPFANGASLSVEFTTEALSDQQALRGAWLYLRTDDAAGLQEKALAFGLKRVVHPYTSSFYIQAPGGQVFRIDQSEEA
ncbi:MAG TPA: VOC family protein [Ktedonobacteraceae bacterium]